MSQLEHKSFSISGLNHLGLVVEDIQIAKQWFLEALELELIEDRGEMFFVKIGTDVLALKTPSQAVAKPEHGGEGDYSAAKSGWQHLDHYGFFAKSPEEVDSFYAFLRKNQVEVLKGPYDRSDGRSVYFRDPCGLVGEYFYFSSAR